MRKILVQDQARYEKSNIFQLGQPYQESRTNLDEGTSCSHSFFFGVFLLSVGLL